MSSLTDYMQVWALASWLGLGICLQCCEEAEALRGQVSQEQELRAVVESCLLEHDSARKDIHAQLQEAQTLAQDAALVLDQLR